ncbi:AAA family ATPase [Staphylococcus hyicus]|uniref:AAA family ATPase n=2 Tax=Staphylococcus hyicus TaxID=1284 RepID=A0ACD5FN48_STAHY|nr:AAA family ATPase [Staphylococcus hyicus]MDP4462638.1 AAA family ATPase [Staphylococcus hyicus]
MVKTFKEFEEELIVTKQLFYNEGSMYGAYGFRFNNSPNTHVKVHPVYNNFTIVGNTPALVEGKTYTIRFKEDYDERRQMDTYTFLEVKSDGLKDGKDQERFLHEILTTKQAKSIIREFGNEDIINRILEDKIDLTLVKGIKTALATNIKLKLADAHKYSEAIVKLSSLGVGVSNVVKLSEHFGSPEMLIKVTDKNIYKLTDVKGFGFKRVDDYALKTGIQKGDSRRIIAGSLYVIEQLVSYGDTKIEIDDFEKSLCDILNIEEVSDDVFSKIMSNKQIYYSEGVISLKKYKVEEELIVKHLRRLRDNFDFNTDKNIESIIESIQDKQGFKFNKEQIEGIKNSLKNGIFILDGKAGSGKSSLLRATVSCIEGYNMSCSLSGKAANVLSQNGLAASTIHRMLKFDPVSGGFIHNQENPLLKGTYILDEASMVDNRLFLDLISAIPNGSQLIIVGDSGQLPAIGRGAVFDYLLTSTEFVNTTLTQVHRQAKDSGTLSTANLVREGKQFCNYNDTGLQKLGENEDLFAFLYQDKTQILDDILFTVKSYVNNPNMNNEDLQVIVGLKEKGSTSVQKLNVELQNLMNPISDTEDTVKGVKYNFRKNDRVIQQGNNYRALSMNKNDFEALTNGLLTLEEIETKEVAVFNGTFGKIVGCVEGYGLLIKFDDIEKPVYFVKNEHENQIGVLDLGYAISVHRSQGSGFKNLIIALSFNDYMLLSKQFLYTALTRTISKCFLFAETSALHYAIKTDKGKTRKCFIGEFLK